MKIYSDPRLSCHYHCETLST